ncbi:hypothetical protein CCR75_005662 [Bremia lactucae]|uniref:Kinesin motor domain-containing protein n=1 Tax=Bremia lactucae TaxID=4779 RepID=A0A976IE46_BRELC|nr:hypothetical protein CCR75_005662 [Bremia lactucae]
MARSSPASNEMGNVRVYCRARPQNAKELAMASSQHCVLTENERIEVKSSDGSVQKFTFDRVFGEDNDQKSVFENVALPVVQGMLAIEELSSLIV